MILSWVRGRSPREWVRGRSPRQWDSLLQLRFLGIEESFEETVRESILQKFVTASSPAKELVLVAGMLADRATAIICPSI